MTSEMAFECLFVSNDPSLFTMVARILRELSVSIDICLRSSAAFDKLRGSSIDLVVIDWDGEESATLLEKIWKDWQAKKPTIMAISRSDTPIPGAHIVLNRPVTPEACMNSFKSAYSRMLRDYRRHARHALMMPVIATREDGQQFLVTVTDIGDGGVGLCTREELLTGDILSFRLQLPGTEREILFHVRVLWTREFSRAGCEFVRIPPVDLMILHEWLQSKIQVKKPLAAV